VSRFMFIVHLEADLGFRPPNQRHTWLVYYLDAHLKSHFGAEFGSRFIAFVPVNLKT
jgi:hypothetical protein